MGHFVVVTDGHGNDFTGIFTDPAEDKGEGEASVFVLFDGRENGFGANEPAVKTGLKPVGNGKYGA